MCYNWFTKGKWEKETGIGMAKKEWEIWEVILEVLAACAACAFLALQIYYGLVYESSIVTMLYHLLPVAFLYAGMSALQAFPEFLNGGGERLQGMVRVYAVRMARNSKALVMAGMLLPAMADALGTEMNAAYSLFLMGGILGNIGYYLYRIFQYNTKQKKG